MTGLRDSIAWMLRGPGFVGCGRAGDVHRVAHRTAREKLTGIVAEDDVRPLAAVAGQGTSAADKRDGRETLMRSAVGA